MNKSGYWRSVHGSYRADPWISWCIELDKQRSKYSYLTKNYGLYGALTVLRFSGSELSQELFRGGRMSSDETLPLYKTVLLKLCSLKKQKKWKQSSQVMQTRNVPNTPMANSPHRKMQESSPSGFSFYNTRPALFRRIYEVTPIF